jgi:hypothetical protein
MSVHRLFVKRFFGQVVEKCSSARLFTSRVMPMSCRGGIKFSWLHFLFIDESPPAYFRWQIVLRELSI